MVLAASGNHRQEMFSPPGGSCADRSCECCHVGSTLGARKTYHEFHARQYTVRITPLASPYRRGGEDSLQGSAGTHPCALHSRLILVFVAACFRARDQRSAVSQRRRRGGGKGFGEMVEWNNREAHDPCSVQHEQILVDFSVNLYVRESHAKRATTPAHDLVNMVYENCL